MLQPQLHCDSTSGSAQATKGRPRRLARQRPAIRRNSVLDPLRGRDLAKARARDIGEIPAQKKSSPIPAVSFASQLGEQDRRKFSPVGLRESRK